jgi:hypothetical protein
MDRQFDNTLRSVSCGIFPALKPRMVNSTTKRHSAKWPLFLARTLCAGWPLRRRILSPRRRPPAANCRAFCYSSTGAAKHSPIGEQSSNHSQCRNRCRGCEGISEALEVHEACFQLDIWRKISDRRYRMPDVIDDLPMTVSPRLLNHNLIEIRGETIVPFVYLGCPLAHLEA